MDTTDPADESAAALPADFGAAVAALRSKDPTADQLGVELRSAAPGKVELEMTVRDQHTNTLGVCHGGVLFTLADIAMSYVSNGLGVRATATSASIEFVAPAQWGTTLKAVAVESSRRNKSAVCDVNLYSDGSLVALFRGTTLQIGGAP